MPSPKTSILVIRISPEDRALVLAAAENDGLETSTWARRVIVLAARRWSEREEARQQRARERGAQDRKPDKRRD